jgi:zinc protease
MLKGMERAYNERDKTASAQLVDEYIRNFLESESIPGIENEYTYYKQYLETITLEEVNQAAANIIPPVTDNKLIVYTGPEKTDFRTPTGDELVAMMGTAAKAEVKPYEEKAVASSLLDKKPAAGKITNEKSNAALGTTELTLSNGIKVILKPTDFKNDQVIMSASRFGGQYNYDVKDRINAEYASTVVGQMGVASFSPNDLRKVLAGKNAAVSTRIGGISESVGGQSSAVDVETMFQLTYLYFTQPRLDAELFSSFVSKQQAMYQNMTSDPDVIFEDSLLNVLYKNHPWAPKIPTPELFTKIDVNRALEIYKQRFSDATGFTFVIVGKFDIAAIKPLLETYLASLPSTGKASTFKDVNLRPTPGPLKFEVKAGTEPKTTVQLLWNGETKYSGDEQLKLMAMTEVLNIKIIETLREDMSGVYGAGMSGSMNKNPYGSYSVSLTIPCGPENADKLTAAALAEIEKIKKSGPAEADLSKVKETWKQQYLISIKDNSFWAGGLLRAVEYGTDPGRILTYEQRVNALMIKDIQDAAKKYLGNNYIHAIHNPVK